MPLPILRNHVAPFETLWDVQREMDRLLDTVWGRAPAEPSRSAIPADVVETDEEIRCTLELPGLKPEDIEVTVENNILTVSGEKKYERTEGDEARGSYHQERRYGRFDRSFILPRNVDTAHVAAGYENGVLTITLPRTEESKPRRVQVGTGNGVQQIATGEK